MEGVGPAQRGYALLALGYPGCVIEGGAEDWSTVKRLRRTRVESLF